MHSFRGPGSGGCAACVNLGRSAVAVEAVMEGICARSPSGVSPHKLPHIPELGNTMRLATSGRRARIAAWSCRQQDQEQRERHLFFHLSRFQNGGWVGSLTEAPPRS